jgi:hypothetical protein
MSTRIGLNDRMVYKSSQDQEGAEFCSEGNGILWKYERINGRPVCVSAQTQENMSRGLKTVDKSGMRYLTSHHIMHGLSLLPFMNSNKTVPFISKTFTKGPSVT